MAVGATGRLSPSYKIEDGVVPRTRLPQIMRRTAEIGRNTIFASSTSLTPATATSIRCCCSTSAIAEQVERALAAGREILEECIAAGGSVTGRARHRRGEDCPDGSPVCRRRSRGHATGPSCIRSRGLLNPGKLMPEEGRRGDGERGRRVRCEQHLRLRSMQCLPLIPLSTVLPLLRCPTCSRRPTRPPWPTRSAKRAQRPAVYPIGGGTMLDYGLPPSRPGVRLSTAMLNRVVDYPAEDLTITVEAGGPSPAE